MRSEPYIQIGSAQQARSVGDSQLTTGAEGEGEEVQHGGANDRGDVLIRGLWEPQMDGIVDVRITDTDLKSQRHLDVEKVLAKHEREKKSQYLQPCLQQRRHFTPFICSVDGILAKEASAMMKRLGRLISAKWDMPLSQVMSFIKIKLSIAILRAAHHCIRGSRIPAKAMSIGHTAFKDGAGLMLPQKTTF